MNRNFKKESPDFCHALDGIKKGNIMYNDKYIIIVCHMWCMASSVWPLLTGFLLLELNEAFTCDRLLHFILTEG